MSPLESRNGTSQNRVRIFNKDQLTKPVVDERWDRIKIVCRQPFNRQTQYGLSFLTLHSPEERLGRFVIKDEEPDTITIGSFFAKNRDKKDREKIPPITNGRLILYLYSKFILLHLIFFCNSFIIKHKLTFSLLVH